MYIGKCRYDVIVTIGREFGSGGREIGRLVANELEIPFYDKELLAVAAAENKISIDKLAKFDEKKASSFFYSVALNPYSGNVEPLDEIVQEIQMKTINTIAEQGSCVIVGRCANKILRDKYDTLDVFITSSIENRIARVSKRNGQSKIDSKFIQKVDRARRAYYNSYGEGEWGEASNYNLCIDSGDLGIDNSVGIILQYLMCKGKLL